MKARNALIAWTPVHLYADSPTAGKVEVELISEHWADWTDAYAYTGGAAYSRTRRLKGADSLAQLFIDFHQIIVGTGIAPETAHKAFWTIDEYRDAVVNLDFYRLQATPGGGNH